MQADTTMSFARNGKGYMMRSERRETYNRSSGSPRPPRHSRGFLYGLVSIIVSIILWPAGMIMLWSRRLKWGAGVKLLSSVLTLVLFVCWIGWALTFKANDYRITRVQDAINEFIESSIGAAGDKISSAYDNASQFGENMLAFGKESLVDGVEAADNLADSAKNKVDELVNGTPTPKPTAEPTEESDKEPTKEPAQEPTQVPTESPSEAPAAADASIEASTGEPTAEPSVEPTAEPSAEPTAEPSAEPTAEPSAEPAAEPSEEPSAEPTAEPTLEVTAAPAKATVKPADLAIETEPTPAPPVKAAGEATVYYTSTGKCYHMASSCDGMSSASAHTLAEAVKNGYRSCSNCHSPAVSVVDSEETLVWKDAEDFYHTTDECPEFNGRWTLVTLAGTAEKGLTPCSKCGATSYVYEAAPTTAPTAEPTEEPTAEPTAEPAAEATTEPTEAPAAEAAPALKSAGEATVYYYKSSVGYHMKSSCVGMSGAPAHTLAEGIAAGKKACSNCNPPAETILEAENVVWVDKNDVYHVSDECSSFSGKWRLMTATDAALMGATPCEACGADHYQPDVLAQPTAEPTLEPTPEPTSEPTEEPTVEPTSEPVAESTPATFFAEEFAALEEEEDDGSLKSAAKAIVYHTSNGKGYHVAESCREMHGAKPYTLEQSVADGFNPCGRCFPPAAELLESDVAWMDESGLAHRTDLCEYFEGQYSLMALNAAIFTQQEGCPFCGMNDIMSQRQADYEAEYQSLMERAKQVTVYFNDNSKYYHAADSCVNMPSADKHNLFEALEKELEHCGRCNPPLLMDLMESTESAE